MIILDGKKLAEKKQNELKDILTTKLYLHQQE